MSKRIFITGGTGLVGTKLVKLLADRGDTPVVLSRKPNLQLGHGVEVVSGDPMKPGDWQAKLAECDAVVSLAGAGVFDKRWNDDYKKVMVDSRVLTTRNVAEAIGKSNGRVKALVSASAIGYYGPRGDEPIDEDAPPAADYLAKLCVDWEAEARAAEKHGCRVAIVRIGVVLDKDGGALKQLITPFKLGGGGPVGSGKQVMAWIHHADLNGLILFALDHDSASGPLNGTAPNPVTNKEFGKALGKALHRPSFVWTPGFMLKLLVGEAANVVLNGQRVLPKRPLALGYTFKYPTIAEALKEIFPG
jgi:uncharacterized protein (TIGR01777 family)